MYACVHTTGDAEPSEHDLPVRRRLWLAVADNTPARIDVHRLRLHHVEMLWRSHAKANVALKVARLVVVPLFAGAVLWEVFRGSHDELGLVCRIGHPLRVYGLIKVAVHGRQMDQALVVQVRKDESLEFLGQPFDQRGHGP